ncbi:MAG TPA: hypothetical protein DHV48_11645 [Prolixibacteraceae bacterium]|nr:hypothetical protein [Prolixibacteraceae bacterium]
MRKTNNVLSVVIVLIICGLSGFAQNNNTTSPFSRYGLGDLHHYGYGRTAAMGGASLGSRHAVQINSANPASYTANDSLSFIFDFGIDGTMSNYKSSTGSLNTQDVNFRYFSLSWPVNRWFGAAMGLQPYSDMGYEVGYTEQIVGGGLAAHSYKGEGSTSKAFFGASVSPFKGLSVGANLNYIFGRLNRNTTIAFDDASIFYIYRTEGTRLRDFSLSYGLQYDLKLKENEFLTLGVTFEKQTELTALHQLFAYRSVTVGSSSLTDTLKFEPEAKNIIKLPSTYGIGLSYNKINKLEINADFYRAAWSKATFFGATDELITDQTRISAGLEYIPEAFSIRSYMKRVKYRAGFHYENSYLMLNNHQINEFGISFGAGLPFPKSKSSANFAIELGTKGTTKDNLIRNNYTKLSLYLNLYDYWFVKRKFD